MQYQDEMNAELDPAELALQEAIKEMEGLTAREMEQAVKELDDLTASKMEEAKQSLIDELILREKLVKEVNDQPDQQKAVDGKHSTPKQVRLTNLEDLSFVRLVDPIHIPSYLVDQIKNRLFTIDKFYDYLKVACTYKTENGPILNNFVYLYAITNVNLRQVKGFLFMYMDILNNSLLISQFSIDKEYWNKGEAVNFMLSFAKQVMKELSASSIVWLTKNVKTCESLGFTRSGYTVMTFEEK